MWCVSDLAWGGGSGVGREQANCEMGTLGGKRGICIKGRGRAVKIASMAVIVGDEMGSGQRK